MTDQNSRLWSKHIKDAQNSGLSGKHYCAKNGLSQASFYYWRKKLNQSMVVARPQTPFVHVIPSEQAPRSLDPVWLAKFLKEMLK